MRRRARLLNFWVRFLFIFKIIYLLMAVPGLRCCSGFLSLQCRGFLIAVASLARKHRLQALGLSSCEPWAESTGSVVVMHPG